MVVWWLCVFLRRWCVSVKVSKVLLLVVVWSMVCIIRLVVSGMVVLVIVICIVRVVMWCSNVDGECIYMDCGRSGTCIWVYYICIGLWCGARVCVGVVLVMVEYMCISWLVWVSWI